MKLYGGIDLHSNSCVLVVLDEQDQGVYQRRLGHDLEHIIGELEPYQDSIEGLVVESTFNWYWLVDGLMEAGYKVHLANTAAIQQYEGLKYTDDHRDARWLAHLLRLGVLPEGYIYPKEDRAVRDLLRKRSQLVQHRTSHVLSVQNLMARNTGRRLSGNEVKRLDFEALEKLFSDLQAVAAGSSLAVVRTLEDLIDLLEQEVPAKARLKPAFKPLLSVPGVGKVLALTIMLETGDIGRFPQVGNYASYCRCVGSEHLSNQGPAQYQERQPVSRPGLYRGGPSCASLLRSHQALLSAQVRQDPPDGGTQGARPPAGESLLLRAARSSELRHAQGIFVVG
jgi:transposase